MKKAFTLIELLIVVLIISTLVSIAAPQYFKIIERFRTVEATTAIMEIKRGQERVMLKRGVYTNNFNDFDFSLKSKNGNDCEGIVCELKYFIIQITLVGNRYIIMAQRKTNNETKPPQRYSPNYIYFYDSATDSFGCTDANCASDFID